MKITNVKAMVAKVVTVGLVAGAFVIAAPAKAQAQFSFGVNVGTPYYDRDSYDHERYEAYYRQQEYLRQQAYARQQAWAQHEAWEQHEREEAREQHERHEAWERQGRNYRSDDHRDWDGRR